MNALYVALIVAVASTVAPLFLSVLNNKQRRAERREDWQRQDAVKAATDEVARQQRMTAAHVDEVAKQAAEAAALLVTSNTEQARASRTIATQLDEQRGQLRQIHTLTNDNLTAAMEGTLEATKGQLILMKRIAVKDITERDVAAIEALESRIAQQEATLGARAKQTAIGQHQAEQTK